MGVYTHPHVAPKTEDQQSWKAKNRVFRGSGAARGVGCLRSKILSIVESVSLLIKKFDPLVFKELRASVSLLRKSKEIKIKSANKEINKEIPQRSVPFCELCSGRATLLRSPDPSPSLFVI